MAAPRLIPCALVLASLTVSACTATTSGPLGGEPRASGVAGGLGEPPAVSSAAPSVTSTPSQAALAPEAYKGELTPQHKAVADALKGVLDARSVKSLNSRLERAGQATDGAATALAALSPPEQVRPQHDAYVSSLREFAAGLSSTSGKVASRDLCTSGAVLTALDDRLKALDAAGEALQQAGDYPADVVTVKAKGKQSRRLGNGSFVRRGSLNGRSSLQIHNGDSRDAVVTLVRGKSKVLSVYVRKKKKFKIRGVSDGSYKIFFTHGADWDGKSRAFTRDCSFERFQESVRFKTTFTATRIRWHDWRITLHAISGGNARTSGVDPDDFPS
ncbi:hypothetical protein [Nonomuraea lactucae]|uniref:hypothetical protein n=1 Tax=Nonomuraea lactucae TaxID=2249762 RepID=UPI0013B39E0C|nr:hypothetical protein [Nonomuraea lactucae]